MSPRAVIVGAPGAGKTTVGELLAARLGVPFRDADAVIEERAGKPIPEIFFDEGEEHFRALETAALVAELAGFDGVLALGGGAVLAEAVSRVGLGAGRPLLAINPRATLKHLLDQRRPLYEAVATITVSTDGREPEEIADELAGRL